MRHANCHFPFLLANICLALALSGCGPAEVAEKKPAAPVHGDLIVPPAPIAQANTTVVSNSPIAPKAEAPKLAVMPQPIVIAAAPKPVPAVAAEKPEKQTAPATLEYASIGFDTLASYNFEVDDTPVTNAAAGPDKADEQIPSRVKAFDHKKVSIRGFMLPLKVSNGVVTEFLIMKDQSMCCYGSVPKITEWVSVKTGHQGVKSIMDMPVSIEGTLHVGAMRENGYLIGIYQMDGDKLIAPEN